MVLINAAFVYGSDGSMTCHDHICYWVDETVSKLQHPLSGEVCGRRMFKATHGVDCAI